MPSWFGTLREIQILGASGKQNPFDVTRRKYLAQLSKYTKRNTILYASSFTAQQKSENARQLEMICDADMSGFMEVIKDLPKDNLDLIIHSPGGAPTAADSIVTYLHQQYPNIRIIVPHLAMSAAAMIACAGHALVMGKHSFLGPIDPQLSMPVTTPGGGRINIANPVQAIKKQFTDTLINMNNPKLAQGLALILNMYGPSLIAQCDLLEEMSKKLVADWLDRWMLATVENHKEKADEIANYLGNHKNFGTHGKHIDRETLREKGLVITNLEEDEKLQELVLSVFHATTHTFRATSAVKIIENHLGRAYIYVAS